MLEQREIANYIIAQQPFDVCVCMYMYMYMYDNEIERDGCINKTDICAKFLLRRIEDHVFFSLCFRQIHTHTQHCRWYVVIGDDDCDDGDDDDATTVIAAAVLVTFLFSFPTSIYAKCVYFYSIHICPLPLPLLVRLFLFSTLNQPIKFSGQLIYCSCICANDISWK